MKTSEKTIEKPKHSSHANSSHTKKSASSFGAIISKFTVGQQIALGFLLVFILMLPVVMYAIHQQTQLMSSANYYQPVTPVQDNRTNPFSFESGLGQDGYWYLYLYLDTKGEPIDGAQFVAHFTDRPDLFSLENQSVLVYEQSLRNTRIVANEITKYDKRSPYTITFGFLSANPNAPFVTYEPMYLGAIRMNLLSDSERNDNEIEMYFDGRTKAISSRTGENLAQLFTTQRFTVPPRLSATTMPTASPTSYPTSYPTSSPYPSSYPLPSPTPELSFNTRLNIMYKLQGADGVNQYYPYPPGYTTATVDNILGTQVTSTSENLFLNESLGTMIVKLQHSVAEPVKATLYLKGEKHLTVTTPVELKSGASLTIDLRNQKIPVGDLNGDDLIDVEDYFMLVRAFNPVAQPGARWEDLNYDGIVDMEDYQLLAENFNPSYIGPSMWMVPPYYRTIRMDEQNY
jgi:hypothetical protein